MHASLRILCIVLIVVIASWGSFFMLTKHATAPAVPTNTDTGVFVFDKGNFALTMLQGWQQMDIRDAHMPKGIQGAEFALARSGTACVLAYVDSPAIGNDSPPRALYIQTTPGERIFIGKTQMDAWWWAPRKGVSADFTPLFEGRMPLPGEMRMSTAVYTVPVSNGFAQFALFTSDGTSVPDICDSESNEMLRSLKDSFVSMSIDAASDGYLRILGSYIKGESFLSFRPISTGVYAYLPIDAHMQDSYVYRDMLYSIRDGSIQVVDVFAAKTSVLPGVLTTQDAQVNGMYIKGDRLWYLLGHPGCNEYMARCALSLYEIPAGGGISKLLSTTTLESGSILGFDQEAGKLYVLSSFGDAGAYSYTISSYDYATGMIVKEVSDSGSVDDPPQMHAAAKAKRSAIESAIGTQKMNMLVRVRDEHLSMPITDESFARALYRFIFPD